MCLSIFIKFCVLAQTGDEHGFRWGCRPMKCSYQLSHRDRFNVLQKSSNGEGVVWSTFLASFMESSRVWSPAFKYLLVLEVLGLAFSSMSHNLGSVLLFFFPGAIHTFHQFLCRWVTWLTFTFFENNSWWSVCY